jgi:hypothetical protein
MAPSLFEQIRMASRSLENQILAIYPINQQPIRLDMAITPSDKISQKLVIAMDWIQGSARK